MNYVIHKLTNMKLIFLGDSGVGKSSLINKHLTGDFKEVVSPSIGMAIHNLKLNDITFRCWDISGNERYNAVRDACFKGVGGVVLIFDLTRPETFNSIVEKWYPLVKQKTGDAPIILCGNKFDWFVGDAPSPTSKEVLDFVRKHNLKYYEISAKTNYNFEKPFTYFK